MIFPQTAAFAQTTGSALATASDIHRQVPTNVADIYRDWLTNRNTDCCFVVIGLVGRQSHNTLLQLKIDPVCRIGPPSLLAPSGCQRIFINIRVQYSIQKNIYIHLWLKLCAFSGFGEMGFGEMGFGEMGGHLHKTQKFWVLCIWPSHIS